VPMFFEFGTTFRRFFGRFENYGFFSDLSSVESVLKFFVFEVVAFYPCGMSRCLLYLANSLWISSFSDNFLFFLDKVLTDFF
jgi:hypothetical protein